MKFKYLGDHKTMNVFGYDFADGATPDVTDEKAIAKLQGNAEFEAVDGETVKAPKEKKQKAADAPLTPEDEKKEPADFVQNTLLDQQPGA